MMRGVGTGLHSGFSHNGEYTLYWMDWTLLKNTQTPSLHCVSVLVCVYLST